MSKSSNFDKVANYYHYGLWDIRRVRNAVKMKWITESEFFEITGMHYSEE